MARGVNKVILIGRLGAKPEARYMPSGDAMVSVNLATTESWKDKNTGEMQERTEWHRLVFFRRLAEIAAQYLDKGSQVYIEGKLQTRKWQDKDGVERYTTEVVVNDMQMLDSRGSGSVGFDSAPEQRSYAPAASQQQHRPAASSPAAPEPSDFDDDIPF